MITNFDYLKTEPKFSAFASVAISGSAGKYHELSSGDGVCGEVDVFGGYRIGDAISGQFADTDEYRRVSTVDWTGCMETHGLYPQMWQ